MEVNIWISGIHIWGNYKTSQPDGTILGWDADMGEMVAYKGELAPQWYYKEQLLK